MPHRVNVILAGGVLLLGLAGASLFRRASSRAPSAHPEEGDTTSVSSQAHAGPGQAGFPSRAGGQTLPPTAIPSYYARQPDLPRPPLPLAKPPHVPSVLDKLYPSPQPPGSHAVPEARSPTAEAESPLRGMAGGLSRSHVIADGDTLPSLAARYLGDPKRSVEIFEANRGVLGDPEVLPLGIELKIPAGTR